MLASIAKEDKKILLQAIEDLRRELVYHARIDGFNAPRTILISQKLDKYINRYQLKY